MLFDFLCMHFRVRSSTIHSSIMKDMTGSITLFVHIHLSIDVYVWCMLVAKNITGGKIEGKITVDFIPLNLNYDLCEELKSTDYKCPLMPKDYTINQSIQIPDIVPKVCVRMCS